MLQWLPLLVLPFVLLCCGDVIRFTSHPTENIIFKKNTPAVSEIEDFVETHLCKLCVILRSRVLRIVCPFFSFFFFFHPPADGEK